MEPFTIVAFVWYSMFLILHVISFGCICNNNGGAVVSRLYCYLLRYAWNVEQSLLFLTSLFWSERSSILLAGIS